MAGFGVSRRWEAPFTTCTFVPAATAMSARPSWSKSPTASLSPKAWRAVGVGAWKAIASALSPPFAPKTTVTEPAPLTEPIASPPAPTTRSAYPSPSTSPTAVAEPNRSPASGVPGMPAVRWVMPLWRVVRTPCAVP